jgi:hypothetical protein
MSTPAGLPNPEGNWTKVPNRFLDCLHMFTPAETALALIVLRNRGNYPISDSHWEKWTGYSDRHKQNAIKGLASQEFFEVVGSGNSARYKPTLEKWSRHITNHPPAPGKPRTAGRGPTVKTPVAAAHPCCIENGCQLTKRDEVSGQPTSVSGEPEKSVSPLVLIKSPSRDSVSADKMNGGQNGLSPVVATENWKPVSNSPEPVEYDFGPNAFPVRPSAGPNASDPKLHQTGADSAHGQDENVRSGADKNVRSEKGQNGLSPVGATENWKPVSNSTAMGLNPRPGQTAAKKPHAKKTFERVPTVPAPLNHEATLKYWPLSWAVVESHFGYNPDVLPNFIPDWQRGAFDLTDAELAQALEAGWTRKDGRMKEPSLWKKLVLEDLPRVRKRAQQERQKADRDKQQVTSMLLKDLRVQYVEQGRREIADQIEPFIRAGPITPEILEQLAKIDGGAVLRELQKSELI